MPRTPEQKAAGQQLTEAIQAYIASYGWGGDGILGDYLVVCEQVRFDEDGDVDSNYNIFYREGSMPEHRVEGLVSVASRFCDDNWNAGTDK